MLIDIILILYLYLCIFCLFFLHWMRVWYLLPFSIVSRQSNTLKSLPLSWREHLKSSTNSFFTLFEQRQESDSQGDNISRLGLLGVSHPATQYVAPGNVQHVIHTSTRLQVGFHSSGDSVCPNGVRPNPISTPYPSPLQNKG